MRYFEDDDDQLEIEISKKVAVINTYLKEIEQKLWENHEFSSLDLIKMNI